MPRFAGESMRKLLDSGLFQKVHKSCYKFKQIKSGSTILKSSKLTGHSFTCFE